MLRFLVEGGTSPGRLAALRGFSSDLKEENKVEELFANRFGQGLGTHAPAPRSIAEQFRNTISPFVRDPRQPLMDRIVAVRDPGIGGRIEGTDTLIDMMRNPESDVAETEIIWALEALSGRILGANPEAESAWLQAKDIPSFAAA